MWNGGLSSLEAKRSIYTRCETLSALDNMGAPCATSHFCESQSLVQEEKSRREHRMDALSGCKSGLALGRFACPFWSILDEIAFLKLCNEWDLANQSITHTTTLASMRIYSRFLYRCKRFFLDRALLGRPRERYLE